MELTSPRTFNSVEDECRYWKERAKQYYKEWTDVKQEYDEYVEQSRQMEAEMDATLDQKQIIIKDLRTRVTSLENENESFKHKFESQCTELTNLEKQLESIKIERDNMRENMRQLEQKNDDLERAHRILNESIADVSKLLDKEYERNALLEMEVDEKEALQEKLQRLMDETRDLKQEINVKSRHQLNGSLNAPTTKTTTPIANGDKIADSIGESTTAADNSKRHHINRNSNRNNTSGLSEYSQQTLKNPENVLNGNAMSASSRTNALNIVADMLRKLNLDKAFLCPQCDRFRCVCDRPSISPFSTNSPAADSSIKRLSRSLSNTFGGSKDSVLANNTNTNTNTITNTNTNTKTARKISTSHSSANSSTLSTPDEPDNLSNSNLNQNLGSNILKRITERISGNTNPYESTKVILSQSLASDK